MLNIPNNVIQGKTIILQDVHAEEKQVYYKCKNIEKSLQCHIQDAMEPKYTAELVNKDTQIIHDNILTILQ